MKDDQIGCDGTGAGSFTKYPAEGAPVTKYGGNTADQDGIVTAGGRGAQVDEQTLGFGK